MASSDEIGVPHPEKAPKPAGGSGGSGGGSGGGLSRTTATATSTWTSTHLSSTPATSTRSGMAFDTDAFSGSAGGSGGSGFPFKRPTTTLPTTTLLVGHGGSGAQRPTSAPAEVGVVHNEKTPAPSPSAGSGLLPAGKSSALPSVSREVSTSVLAVTLPSTTEAVENSSSFGSTTFMVVILLVGAVILAGYRRWKGRLARSGYSNISDSRGGWQTVDTMDDEFGLDDARLPSGGAPKLVSVEMTERTQASAKTADMIGLSSNLAFGDEENLDEFFGGGTSNSYQATTSDSRLSDDLFTGGSVREISVVDGQLRF